MIHDQVHQWPTFRSISRYRMYITCMFYAVCWAILHRTAKCYVAMYKLQKNIMLYYVKTACGIACCNTISQCMLGSMTTMRRCMLQCNITLNAGQYDSAVLQCMFRHTMRRMFGSATVLCFNTISHCMLGNITALGCNVCCSTLSHLMLKYHSALWRCMFQYNITLYAGKYDSVVFHHTITCYVAIQFTITLVFWAI